MQKCVHVISALMLLASHAALSAKGEIVRASAAGAHLDSNLLKGGGTDDTAALQAILNRAANGTPVHVIVDGPALVSGLDVYGNSTVECVDGAGLYLKDGSNRAIIRNAHRSREAIKDEHIELRGCFLNGNRTHQAGVKSEFEDVVANQEADGTWITGLQFLGVNDLTLENLTLWSTRAIAALFANANYIDIRNVTIDTNNASSDGVHVEDSGTDGLHFSGNVRYVTINGVKLRTGDDALAFEPDDFPGPNDYGPYVKQGPITDVTVSNVEVMDAEAAVRIVSSRERIDRVVISNVTGTVNGCFVVGISHYVNSGVGNIGSITLANVNVNRSDHDAPIVSELSALLRQRNRSAELIEFNGGVFPAFNINAHAENLILRNVATKAVDDRPILRIGPDSDVQRMTAELTIDDPGGRAVPVVLDEGARVGRLNLYLDWKGRSVDVGKKLIQNKGGTIAELHWVNTPPRYVDAELSNASTVVVTFSQDVKAGDFTRGVSIKVDGRPVGISRAFRKKGYADAVQYVLKAPIHGDHILTWTYDAAEGDIQNWNGDQLLSIAEK